MKSVFKVAKYEKEGEGFKHIGYDEYLITYLKGTKVHQLRIVVNGVLTKDVINLLAPCKGYKKIILSAISDYKNGRLAQGRNPVNKWLSLSYVKQFYSKLIVNNVQNYLIDIKKEESRDVLTEFELI